LHPTIPRHAARAANLLLAGRGVLHCGGGWGVRRVVHLLPVHRLVEWDLVEHRRGEGLIGIILPPSHHTGLLVLELHPSALLRLTSCRHRAPSLLKQSISHST